MKKISILSLALVGSMAHAISTPAPQNDIGSVGILSNISNSTCLLQSTDQNGTTGPGATYVRFGTIPLSEAQAWRVSAPPPRSLFTNFSLKSADGTSACDLHGSKWDISMNIDLATQTHRIINGTLYGQDAIQFLPTNLVLLMRSRLNARPVYNKDSALKLYPTNVSQTWGVLMSGQLEPSLNSGDVVWLEMDLYPNNQNQVNSSPEPVSSGVFGLTIPLTVVYK